MGKGPEVDCSVHASEVGAIDSGCSGAQEPQIRTDIQSCHSDSVRDTGGLNPTQEARLRPRLLTTKENPYGDYLDWGSWQKQEEAE